MYRRLSVKRSLNHRLRVNKGYNLNLAQHNTEQNQPPKTFPAKMFLRQQVRGFHATAKRFDLSKMTIVGRVGTEFSEFTSANNNRYVKYSVASQPRKDGPTSWFNVTVFSEPQINFLTQYVNKGALVYIEADASQYAFEREDGSKGVSLNLVQREVNLLKNGKPEETEVEGQ